jgi:hypothetical protein
MIQKVKQNVAFYTKMAKICTFNPFCSGKAEVYGFFNI